MRMAALLIRAGKVVACGEYSAVHAAHPDVPATDLRGGFLLPGFIDTHIHFPQLQRAGRVGTAVARLAGIRRASRRSAHG